MNDDQKTKEQLIAELEGVRQRLALSESALKLAQEGPHTSHEGMMDLMEQSPLGFQVFDQDGKPLWVNKAWEKLWGISKEYILTADYNMLEDKKVIANGLMPLVKKGFLGEIVSIPSMEYDPRETLEAGQTRWISTWIYPIKDAAGNVLKVIFMYEDVSEQMLAVNSLKLNEEKYRLLVDNQSDLLVKVDPEGRFQFVSPSYCETFGKSEEELLGHTFMPLVHEDDRESTARAMEDLFQPPHQAYLEQRAMTRDGWKWLGWQDSVLLDKDGNVASIIGVGRDITDRKKAEDELKIAKEFAENLLETANIMVVTLDTQARITTFNRHAAELTGFDRDDVLGKNWFDLFVPPHESENIPSFFEDTLGKMPHTSQHENFILKKNGDECLVSWSNNVLLDSSGKVSGVLSMGMDITKRTRDAEEKRALALKIQHSQKLESLGVLAGGIAHDFNNLLMAILGNTDLALLELSPVSPARNHLQEIEKISRRAAELVHQMLAYSGKGRFVLQSINASELIEEISHLLEVSVSKKAILKYNFSENLPTFDADATQVRQVIMNLITNASEAIGENSGVISLSTGVMECDLAYLNEVNNLFQSDLDAPLQEGIYTYFEVADTGCGMNAATIEKIFDPFFSTKFTGRGLGLSAVLGIMRGHKGALKIYSEEGKGTTFKVLFPANELSGDYTATWQIPKTSHALTGTGTILIVDDEEDIRTVTGMMVQRLGFSVLKASDGRQALNVFREKNHGIVCVILDLTMPHMDGEETFREMRRLSPGVRVLLCSGYNEQDATQHFAGKGLAGFIQKPFNMVSLQAKLAEVLPG